jgi:hypothetical protein
MSEISEAEIKAMSKEQNYLKGYADGKSDTLNKIRAEIIQMPTISLNANDIYKADVLAVIDKYKAEGRDKE